MGSARCIEERRAAGPLDGVSGRGRRGCTDSIRGNVRRARPRNGTCATGRPGRTNRTCAFGVVICCKRQAPSFHFFAATSHSSR